MKAQQILEAVSATLAQRGQENGYDKAEERSAAEIVRTYNLKRSTGYMSEADAWEFMRCLKEVRLKRQLANGGDPTDTLIDLIGYTVLLAECLTEEAESLAPNYAETVKATQGWTVR